MQWEVANSCEWSIVFISKRCWATLWTQGPLRAAPVRSWAIAVCVCVNCLIYHGPSLYSRPGPYQRTPRRRAAIGA